MNQCKSCGGTYEPKQGNETYFHICPPYKVDKNGNQIPIDNPRDENIKTTVQGEGDKTRIVVSVISEGKGYLEL